MKFAINHSKGAILIMILIFIVIIEILIIPLAFTQKNLIKNYAAHNAFDSAMEVTKGAEYWAIGVLKDVELNKHLARLNKTYYDKNQNYVEASIIDLQGRLNFNNLFYDNIKHSFNNSILPVFNKISDNNEDLLHFFLNISENEIFNLSELKHYRQLNNAIFNIIKTNFTAIPKGTKINILTANPYSISSILPNTNLEQAVSIYEVIKDNPHLKTVADINKQLASMGINESFSENLVTSKSEYFLLQTHIYANNIHYHVESKFKINDDNGVLKITMYSREINPS